MATLRTVALNLLRLAGYQSIRAGMQAVTSRHLGSPGDGDDAARTKLELRL
jgi:hypothetical protein